MLNSKFSNYITFINEFLNDFVIILFEGVHVSRCTLYMNEGNNYSLLIDEDAQIYEG